MLHSATTNMEKTYHISVVFSFVLKLFQRHFLWIMFYLSRHCEGHILVSWSSQPVFRTRFVLFGCVLYGFTPRILVSLVAVTVRFLHVTVCFTFFPITAAHIYPFSSWVNNFSKLTTFLFRFFVWVTFFDYNVSACKLSLYFEHWYIPLVGCGVLSRRVPTRSLVEYFFYQLLL